MRAHICVPTDRATLDCFVQALHRLGYDLTATGWGIGTDVFTIRIGGQPLTVHSDTWAVEVEGAEVAVRSVLMEMAQPGSTAASGQPQHLAASARSRSLAGTGIVLALDHVQLPMPPGAENRARTFYRQLLGLAEETRPPALAARGGCWFRAGNAILHLGAETDFVPQKRGHPAFVVRDIEGLAERLFEAGHPVVWDDSLPDRRRFYTADPFGNRIELMRDGDGFGQRD